MRYFHALIWSIILCTALTLHGQEVDSTFKQPLLVPAQLDTMVVDTMENKIVSQAEDYSKLYNSKGQQSNEAQQRSTSFGGSETTPIKYGATDSSYLDMARQELHLYGEAFVTYTDYEVKADYIVLNFNTNNIRAETRKQSGPKASFTSGDQNAKADEILFNIDSQKGLIYGANIVQNNLYIHGAVTKFVRGEDDSLHIEDVIYNKNALITSCNLDHPHWGIRSTKLKFIPDRLAVVGPSNMELAGIPTPLVMPFAFVPLVNLNNAASGLIFPRDPIYQSPQLGLGVRGLGYYLALSEYADLTLSTDLYTRGSWFLSANSNYRKRYKYNGAINLSLSKQLLDVAGQTEPNIQNSYSVSINHNQDGKAHPYRRIGGSLRFTVNDFDRRNFEDAQSQLNSQINSNFSYSYQLTDNWTFTSAISHSQNTLTRKISFTIPDVQMRMRRIFPFKTNSSSSNNEKWFEKINLQYDGKFENSVSTVDTLLFTKETLESFRGGFTHQIDMAASYNLLEHFSFNTSINYDEFWYLQTHELAFDSTETVDSRVIADFKPLREMTVSAGLTTNIFGTIQFKKGWLRGLRHQMRPTISLNYSPSTESYYEFFDGDPDISLDKQIRYNPFSPDNPFNSSDNETLFRSNDLERGGMSINYSLANTFEGKYYSKKDSSEKKFKIFNSLNLSGNYNLQADSLNWSTINLSANATMFKNISNLSITGTFDPYIETSRGRINTTVLSQGGGLVRLDVLTLSLATNFTLKDIRDLLVYGGDPPRSNNTQRRDPDEPEELFSWFQDARIRHVFRYGFSDNRGVKSWDVQAHSIQLTTGNIPLTDKWGMSVGNLSYDLKNKRWVYPSFTLNRDLHCWRMSISWQPQASTYSFFIGVKAAPFAEFLKYQSGRSAFDASFIN